MAVIYKEELGRQKWDMLPQNVLDLIIDDLRVMECVHEEDRFQPFFRQTEDEESEPEAASLYQDFAFARRLMSLKDVSETWAHAVRGHIFWADLSDRICGQHFPIGRKCVYGSNVDLAFQYCWICALYDLLHADDIGGQVRPVACKSRYTLGSSNLGVIPVCKHHQEVGLCQGCFTTKGQAYQLSIRHETNNLVYMYEEATYGLKEALICRRCRISAIERLEWVAIRKYRLPWSESETTAAYVLKGHGNARDAGRSISHYGWLHQQSGFVKLMNRMTEEHDWMISERKPSMESIGRTCLSEGCVFHGLSEEHLHLVIKRFYRQLVRSAISTGWWPFLCKQGPIPNTILKGSQAAVILDHPGTSLLDAPDMVHRLLEGKIEREIESRLFAPLENLIALINAQAGGCRELTTIKAESLNLQDLLSWLNDPRVLQGCVLRSSAHNLSMHKQIRQLMASRGTKRKRSDSGIEDTSPLHTRAETETEQKQPRLSPNEMLEKWITSGSFEMPRTIIGGVCSSREVLDLPWLEPGDPLGDDEQLWLRNNTLPTSLVMPKDVTALPRNIVEIMSCTWETLKFPFAKCRCGICQRTEDRISNEQSHESNFDCVTSSTSGYDESASSEESYELEAELSEG